MACVNPQTWDAPLRLERAKFGHLNGNCGYVLKPGWMGAEAAAAEAAAVAGALGEIEARLGLARQRQPSDGRQQNSSRATSRLSCPASSPMPPAEMPRCASTVLLSEREAEQEAEREAGARASGVEAGA